MSIGRLMAATKRKTLPRVLGLNIYSYGLVHLGTLYDKIVCGAPSQYGPPMTVHQSEPITCFQCLAIETRSGA